MGMSIQALHIGMKVRHPSYGVGDIKSLTEHTAEISFEDKQRTIAPESSDLTVAEPVAVVSELQLPLDALIRQGSALSPSIQLHQQPGDLVQGQP